ncbi:MAG: hypothetical protein ACLRS8_08620 [Parabacteroides merdae]
MVKWSCRHPSCCASAFYNTNRRIKLTTGSADTYTNPKDAAAAAEKALLLLSQNLNKGISQVDNAGQEIDKK